MPSQLTINASASAAKTFGIAVGSSNGAIEYSLTLAEGDGDNESDANLLVEHEIAATTELLIDLSSQTDIIGNAFAFDTVKKIVVSNLGEETDGEYVPADGETVHVGGAGSNPFYGPFNNDATAKVQVLSGGIFVLCGGLTGWAVTSTSKILRVYNAGSNPNTVRIQIEGVKA